MEWISKNYIVDENNKKIAVQVPIETFEKIEEILEDYALFNLMTKNTDEGDSELLEVSDARDYYGRLLKNLED